jgi:hypothetical protein
MTQLTSPATQRLLDDPVQKKKQAIDELIRKEVRYVAHLKSNYYFFFVYFVYLVLFVCLFVLFVLFFPLKLIFFYFYLFSTRFD